MIDFDNEMKKLTPININVTDLNKNEIPKNVRNSIALYNKSILNLKLNSVDLAILDLKKSLSLNPSFGETLKLLGLCYAKRKDFRNAEKYFKKLAKYTIYHTIANDYLKELTVEKTTSQALDAIRGASTKKSSNIFFKRITRKFALFFSLPIIVILVSAYLIHSNIQTISNKAASSNEIKSSTLKTNSGTEQKKITDSKYVQMDENYKNLQKDLENTKSDLDSYKNKYDVLLQLNDAEKLYNDGDYEKAVDILISLRNSSFDTETKEKFNTLWSTLKSNAVWTIYKQANNLYKQKKYADALPKLKEVEAIAPDPKLMPWILYQIAMCYNATNDSTNALSYFQKVKTDYPNSTYASYSDSVINQINH